MKKSIREQVREGRTTMAGEYPKTAVNKLGRLPKRGRFVVQSTSFSLSALRSTPLYTSPITPKKSKGKKIS